ncbi:glycosyltransferase [Arthrobacter sp. BF1]|uniref:glycosyltransferase n=1 Tax=Arthrobacter sp. BF1 TaxID=2821145 RepID=UPI00358DFD6D
MKRHQDRLVGESRTFSGWTPVLPKTSVVPIKGRVLHLLTNSLPHTGSGYAQRSHSILLAQQEAGREVLAVTRLGYPVQVGKVLAVGEDLVDGVRYRRMIPSSLAPTPDARLQQEAEELLKVAVEFRPDVMHTTTHFANGLVVGAVAKALNIPWVYEVRGQLADTWASTRGDAGKESERYAKFQASEARVMQDADAVVTLGTAMLDGIVSQGIASDKVDVTELANMLERIPAHVLVVLDQAHLEFMDDGGSSSQQSLTLLAAYQRGNKAAAGVDADPGVGWLADGSGIAHSQGQDDNEHGAEHRRRNSGGNGRGSLGAENAAEHGIGEQN